MVLHERFQRELRQDNGAYELRHRPGHHLRRRSGIHRAVQPQQHQHHRAYKRDRHLEGHGLQQARDRCLRYPRERDLGTPGLCRRTSSGIPSAPLRYGPDRDGHGHIPGQDRAPELPVFSCVRPAVLHDRKSHHARQDREDRHGRVIEERGVSEVV